MNHTVTEHWTQGPVLALDTETTGTDVETARIVTCAVVQSTGAWTRTLLYGVINPGVPIPPEASAVHGVTDDIARTEGVDPVTGLTRLASHLAYAVERGVPIVIYNARFDWTILHRELHRHGLAHLWPALEGARIVDPLVIDRAADKYRRGKRTLEAVAQNFCIDLSNAHDAVADAIAAAEVALAQQQRYPHLRELTPQQLHNEQAVWAALQASDLQAYLRRAKDPAAVVEGAWPLVPPREVTA